jgi:hypothetical protein
MLCCGLMQAKEVPRAFAPKYPPSDLASTTRVFFPERESPFVQEISCLVVSR